MRIFKIVLLLLCANLSLAQQTKYVDFLRCKAELTILPVEKVVSGIVTYSFKMKKATDSIFIDAKNMTFDNVYINKKRTSFNVTNKKIWLFKHFKKNKEYTVSFNYRAQPKKAMYFIDWEHQSHSEANPQVWTQGQGKDNSNWIPSFDDMNEKIEFDLSILFDENYSVVTNGKLLAVENTLGKKNWIYNMKQPMSSYLLAIAIGKYKKTTKVSKSGIPLDMYYYPEDYLKIEPTYRYSKRMFDFLEEEIGVAYPWQNYKQIPVKDFLYAGMENTSVTVFSDAFVVDSIAFVDKNYVNVNAHELAHQWFGDLVTETHGTHHWLQEGFATYYALLAEKNIFGDDYYYHKLYKTSQQLIKAQKTDTIPLMNPKASSLTFYQKGAWALHSLREQVGDSVFKLSVQKYLTTHQFRNVETNDFINIVEKQSKQDLSAFVNTWLLSSKFPEAVARESINKSAYRMKMEKYLTPFTVTDGTINNSMDMLLDSTIHYSFKNDFINTYKAKDSKELFNKAFTIENIKIRQFLSEKFQIIPVEYKADFESLLNDKSYQTIEMSLLSLWLNFPDNRKQYLDQTENLIGFNDKNIRTLWLALALNTKGFEKIKYHDFYKELVMYTDSAYHFEVRKNAFKYLDELHLINTQVLQSLKQATTHHNWRFRSYCKKLLADLSKENNN